MPASSSDLGEIYMHVFNFKRQLCAIPLLLLTGIGGAAQAATLSVNCGGKYGLTSINAAIKAIQSSEESRRPATINVSGACNENVVIQSLDRLTLNAAPGASINDPSGGNLDVIDIADSRDVSVNNFTINGGAYGISCLDRSLCRLNGNSVQGANTSGVGVFFSQTDVIGGILQNNATGLSVYNGSEAKALGVTIKNNGTGIEIRTHSFLNTDSTISGNSGSGVFAHFNATVHCLGCTVSGNGDHGVIIRRNSTVRFGGATVTGNVGGGVLLSEESSTFFGNGGNVTGNPGRFDVSCGTSATSAKFATFNINGGTTNCVEPVDP
jgi:hypothetical protein